MSLNWKLTGTRKPILSWMLKRLRLWGWIIMLEPSKVCLTILSTVNLSSALFSKIALMALAYIA